MDQAPDRIGAYTFSRKAAGEIFDEIMGYLLEAASSTEQAAQTSDRMGDSRTVPEFEQDLRLVFQHLHRLRIGTLDSRIAQMLSAASVELGLPSEFAVLDRESPEYRRLQFRILNHLFGGGRGERPESDLFLQLFEEATHGKAEKNLFRELEGYIAGHRVSYLTHPHQESWQGPVLNSPPQILDPSEREAIAGRCLEQLPEIIGHKTLQKSLTRVIEACRDAEPGFRWSASMPQNNAMRELMADQEPLLHYGKTGYPLPEAFYQDIQALLDHACALQVEEVQTRTLAIYGFLKVYEEAYRRNLLPGGTLAFEDACELMSRFEDLTPAELAFRLDGEIDHWLLDEFQDTNQLQWNVLSPFLDEVRMDPELQRSFFYVGDVKQAIYGWRGGDSELFGRIQEEWPGMKVESLDISFRSAQPVLNLVNQLMDRIPEIEEINQEGIRRWNREFTPHTAAKDDLPGFSQVLQCMEPETSMIDPILHLAEILPEKRDVAILTRTNDEGRQYAEALRARGFQVSLEGSSPARDDTGVELVLAAFRLAAHPGDRFSRVFLKLAGCHPDPSGLLQQVNAEGMAKTVRSCIQDLPLETGADFSRHRLDRLMNLALEYDEQGDRSIDRFLTFVDQAHLKEHEAHGLIRIMTIHQSKGLGFDAVILPIGDSASMCKLRPGALGVQDPETERPRLTLLPAKEASKRIPEYREIYTKQEEDATYEALCLLYVALTRAKQSLHVLLPAAPKRGQGSLGKTGHWIASRLPDPPTTSQLLPPGMQCLFEDGLPDVWHAAGAEIQAVKPSATPFPLESGPLPIPRMEPSQADSGEQVLDHVFSPISKDGRQLGTRVHELMCDIEWSDSLDLESFLKQHGESSTSEAAQHVRTLVNLPEMREFKPSTGLWREKKFESVLPDGWITGIFDRVILLEKGAVLQDFKTNRNTGPETVDHYRPQMQMYRRVLSDMLSVEPESITCQLLFSGTGEVVDV